MVGQYISHLLLVRQKRKGALLRKRLVFGEVTWARDFISSGLHEGGLLGEVAGLLGVHGRFIGERGSGVDREYGGVIGECHVSREMGDHERIVLVNVLIEDF